MLSRWQDKLGMTLVTVHNTTRPQDDPMIFGSTIPACVQDLLITLNWGNMYGQVKNAAGDVLDPTYWLSDDEEVYFTHTAGGDYAWGHVAIQKYIHTKLPPTLLLFP